MPQLDFRQPRLFVDAALAAGETLALERSQSNYLGNVLRLSERDTILVFNGRDGEWQAAIIGRKRPDSLEIVTQIRPQDRLPDLAYVFAPLKLARLDYMRQNNGYWTARQPAVFINRAGNRRGPGKDIDR